MERPIIAVCVEGGIVQYVATNIPSLTARVIIIDRDCDSPDADDPVYHKYFAGGDAYIYSDILALDPEYCEKAASLVDSQQLN